jgi:signal transduction histidine kinase
LREEIFNPFVTTKKTGVGLGLSIVSKIIDGHHGTIRVENAPEGGAVFTIFFPLEVAAEPLASTDRPMQDQPTLTSDGVRSHTT